MDELLARYARIAPQVRYLMASAVFAAVLLIYYVLFQIGVESSRARAQADLQKASATRAEKRAYADNLSKYEARLEQLQENLSAARAQLPDTADTPTFLAQISAKASAAGLTIESFTPQEETQKDFYAELTFAMQVRGSFHEIVTFIDAVGKLDRIVNVMGINMTNPKEENQKVVLEGHFSVKTYRFLPEGAVVASDDKEKADKKKGKRTRARKKK